MPPLVEHLLFTRPEWDNLLADAVQPYVTGFMQNGGVAAESVLAQIGLVGAFDVENPQVQAFIKEYTFKRISDINDTSAAAYRQIFSDAHAAGEGYREVAARIESDEKLGFEGTRARAEMIARTEGARAEIEGSRQALVGANEDAEAGGNEPPFQGFYFVPSPDCCEDCWDYNGMTVDMNGELELVHPNCRCGWEPIISPAYGG